MKKGIVLGLILLLSFVLYGCGEPELDISKDPGKGYYLQYKGTTSDEAKITLKDESGETKKLDVDKNSFTALVPRLTSKAIYTVIAKDKDKETETKLVVPKQKKLVSYEDLKGQFNYIYETEDKLSISLPDSINSNEEITPGFKIMSDGNNVMSILLTYSSEDNIGITDYNDFTYSIAAIMMSLDSENSLDKVLDALNNSMDNQKENKVTVNDITYQFSTINAGTTNITTLEIFPN
ncbi:TPA: hypothetical protein ACSZF6_10245 [Listeria monocytogenes]|uniref:Lipoprotein n=1 Tax=Listeria monocytogenes TaxID=1639 RepID=A0A7U7LL66_LISMN|nr:hypothetical protein [Listeria monocytogenes]EAF5010620.1 hypothetical protein [Listeria innocua]EAA0055131.1 hypothetical protein [Listeria monocytogenes]EAA0075318.1 hypothetical protein [Listeria monocytogenes]EAA0154486.1 hypothetical protein [Listeria monocytogenes]EAA0163755.1 hypothetical protein [Listeria monocytogenes]